MTSVVFNLDMYDNVDSPLEMDLVELWDYCVENNLEFEAEFLQRVFNYVAYTSDGGTTKEADPMVYSIYLDVDDVGFINISMVTQAIDGGWMAIADQLYWLLYYGDDWNWDDRFQCFMAHVMEEGWEWQNFTFRGIEETMSNFLGIFDNAREAIDKMISDDLIEAIPDWVVLRVDDSFENLKESGRIKAITVNWREAIWV